MGSIPMFGSIVHKYGGTDVSNSSAARAAQLGMPFGTAAHRLRKMIMFSLLVKLGENTCYRCGEEISSVDSLSVEHKQPWLHVNADLFWDLGNVAFSHLSCNRPDRPGSSKGFRKRPPSVAWCSGCLRVLPSDRFQRHAGRTSGRQYMCKACRNPMRRKPIPE